MDTPSPTVDDLRQLLNELMTMAPFNSVFYKKTKEALALLHKLELNNEDGEIII